MVMRDFIRMGSIELFGIDWDWKIQNENICLQKDSNPSQATTGESAL